MSRKKYIIICVFILVLIIVLITAIFLNKKEKTQNNIEEQKEIKEISVQENITEEEKKEINTVKNSTGMTGETELYEVQESYGIKIATIKSGIKYKVAFSGMIKNSKPEMSEIDNLTIQNHPKYAGIWIYEEDRDEFLNLLKKVTDSSYKIDENGYLKIDDKNKQNDNDKKLEKAIRGDKLYIFSISSVCYIVDEVSGEILDYNFEDMDKYQTYEYFEEDDKMILFMNENSDKQLSDDEIINSVIALI